MPHSPSKRNPPIGTTILRQLSRGQVRAIARAHGVHHSLVSRVNRGLAVSARIRAAILAWREAA